MPPQASALEALPTEMLAQIVDHTKAESGGAGMYALLDLCITCKTLNAVATPVLYRVFNNCSCAKALPLIVRTASEKPAYARYIKTLVLKFWTGKGHQTAPTHSSGRELLDVIAPVALDARLYFWLREALWNDAYDGQAALLLLLGTGVEGLNICLGDRDGQEDNTSYLCGYRAPSGKYSSLVSQLLYLATSGQAKSSALRGVLPKVKDIDIHIEWPLGRDERPRLVPAETLAPFFCLPSVESFKGCCLGQLSVNQMWTCVKDASSVKRLVLNKCNLDTKSVVAMLGRCEALVELAITWSATMDPANGLRSEDFKDVVLDFGAIGQALESHKTTLKTLKLDTFSSGDVTFRPGTGLTSLSTYTRLERLDADCSVLCGISNDGSDGLVRLSEFISTCMLPSLTVLHVMIP